MKTLSRVRITSGPSTGKQVLKEFSTETKLVLATYDLDGEQIVDFGNHEWTELEELGQYEDDDTDAFWSLI